jgi:hypothetical protein
MIKLINILNELNIQKKPQLGSGDNVEGEAYDFIKSPDKIIKKYTQVNSEFKYAQYNLMKQYPQFFVKIHKMTDKYIVMEKVKVPIDNLKELQDFIKKEVDLPWVRGKEGIENRLFNSYSSDVVNGIYLELKENQNSVFKKILEKVKEYKESKKYLYNLLIRLYNFLLNLKKSIPSIDKYWLDIHDENIGEDKQGNFKLFDIGYDEEFAEDDEDEDDDED